jgi:hypothetical protein
MQASSDDNSNMDEKPTRRSAGAAALVLVAFLVLLPLLYILSVGPIRYLVETGRLTADEGSVVGIVYQPLLWGVENCRPFGSVMEAYANLWDPNSPNVVIAPPAPYVPPAPARNPPPAKSLR